MSFLIDSVLVFHITLDTLKIWTENNVKSFEFSGYKMEKDTLVLSTRAISGSKSYKLIYENGKVDSGKIYFEKGKSANYFLIFFQGKYWIALGISEKPSSVWINDSVLDLIEGQYFIKKLSQKPYKLKVVRNKVIILKDYRF
ncbi:MAG: hypothetical protein N2504_00370 [candidate division WOR-3 bacterium]|nr:hypothetical protein [candidate division WOR-3 bacterium]MCX7947029.1 hypothetical protein [candidate division WOR-3 bacterium]MDW8149930.1 hypothetical protein [candidate division WOR-3 bacterium]